MAAKASASKSAVPKGMTQLAGGYAKTWNVEEKSTMHGAVSEAPRTVTLTQGKKTVDRRCIEVKDEDGERYTVWESAGLVNLFEALTEKAPCKVWIHFTGYGTAKKGQNAPKLFETAIG